MKPTVLLSLVLIVCLVWLSLHPGVAHAAGFTVTKFIDTNDGVCNSDCSLREAIIAANASPESDTITLPAGTYTLSLAAEEGDLVITSPLTLAGQGPSQTIIDAAGTGRVLDMQSGAGSVTISGVSIVNGAGAGSAYGAGIHCYQADLNLDNVLVSNNHTTAPYAGGIYAYECTVNLDHTQVVNNSAYYGGGISAYHSTVALTYSQVSENDAGGSGGGILGDGSALSLNYTTLLGNTADDNGAGLYARGAGSTVTVANSLVVGNVAGSGAGGMAFMSGLSATVDNSTVSGNRTNGSGGGIEDRIPLTITHSTIVNNIADDDANNDGDGGGLFAYQSNAQVSVSNTIFADNIDRTSVDYADCTERNGGSVTSQGYNLVKTDGYCTFSATGDITGQPPLLGGLQNNGGATWTHALLSGSPAFNAGDPAFTPPPLYDQRGPGFSRVVKGRLDIGAYEEGYRVYLPLVRR